MSIKQHTNTPENTLNYMKYVEIEDDTRFPTVTGGSGSGTFNKSAILVSHIDPYNINLSSPQSNQLYIEKFGANLNVGAAMTTIWETGDIYTYLTTASVVSATSTEPSIDRADPPGNGARTIVIEGLDSDYNTISEILSVGGPPSNQEFLRISRSFVKTAGSIGTNRGIITVKAGSITVITIGIRGSGGKVEGFGQSLTSVYTVPAGKTGYLTQWTVGTSVYNAAVQAFISFSTFDDDSVFRTKDLIFCSDFAIKDYKVPLLIPEKTDVEVRAYASNGTPVSTTYNIILINN
jgi:hypothetical protein